MNDTRHTLQPILLSPAGPYRCGDVVTGTWTLRNYGDAETSEARLRIDLAPGLTLIPERSRIPGVEASELPNAFATPKPYENANGNLSQGVQIRSLTPGDALTATFAFRIERVTDDSRLWVQVCLISGENEQYISPQVEIPVRLAPRITVPTPEVFTIKADNQHFGLRVRVANEGGVAEHGVRVVVPVPKGVDVNQPIAPAGAQISTDAKTNAVIVDLAEVPPYDHAEIGFQFRANDALFGDLVEITDIRIESPSSGSFHLEPVPARLERSVDFSASCITIEPGPYVESGGLVDVTVHVSNNGRSHAREVILAVDLPEALIYAHGSLSINEATDARRDDLAYIVLPVIRAHTTTLVRFKAIVKSPMEHQARSVITAMLDGEVPISPCEFGIESKPNFPLAENYVWVESPLTIEPHAERKVFVKVSNTGTDISRQVRLRIDAPEITLHRATVNTDGAERNVNIIPILGKAGAPSSAIDLGSIGPQEERIVTLFIMAPETFTNGASFPMNCFLRHDGQNEVALNEQIFQGRSFPRISDQSVVISQRMENLRIGQIRNLSAKIRNDGSDVATNVHVALDLPEGLRIERVSGAELLENGDILFHDIPPQATSEATISMRVVGTAAGEGQIEIHPIVSGDRMNTVHLKPLLLATASQSFLDEVHVEAKPIEHEAALMVRITFKNIGDGAANNVMVTSDSLNGYAINTTSYNGNLIRDIKGDSILAYGLNVGPIAPGETVEIVYAVNPKGDDAYVGRFHIESDDQEPIDAESAPYRPQLKARFMPQFLDAGNTARMHLPNGFAKGEQRQLPAAAPETRDVVFRVVEHTAAGASDEQTPSEEPVAKVEPTGETIDADFVEEPTQHPSPSPEPAATETTPHIEEATRSTEAQAAETPAPPAEIVEEPTAPGADRDASADETASEGERKGVLRFSQSARDEDEDESVPIKGDASASRTVLRFGNRAKATGPMSVLHLTPQRLERTLATINMLFKHDGLGWYRHMLAMRLFAPDELLGVDPDVEAAWENVLVGIDKDLKVPVMRLIMPSFSPSIEWAKMIENDESIEGVGTLLQAMPAIFQAQRSYNLPEFQPDDLYGPIGQENFAYFDEYEDVTVHHLNALLPELLPTSSTKWADLGNALNAYRQELARTFKSIAYMGDAQRHERMLQAPSDEMDDALRNIHLIIEHEVAA